MSVRKGKSPKVVRRHICVLTYIHAHTHKHVHKQYINTFTRVVWQEEWHRCGERAILAFWLYTHAQLHASSINTRKMVRHKAR